MTRSTLRWSAVPGGPPIPGLRFRPYAGRQDLAPLLALLGVADRANGSTETWNLEELRLEHEEWTHVDPRDGEWLAFVEDQLVATSRFDWVDSTDGRRFYRSRGHVHPEWRRRGLGAALMAHSEACLIGLSAGHDATQPAVLVTDFEAADLGARTLAGSRGYRHARTYYHMTRLDLEAVERPPLPAGLEVRPVTGDLLPQLWEAMVEAFQDHFGELDGSPEAYRRWMSDPNLDLSLAVVAFEGDAIAGAVLGYVVPEENEVHGYQRGWTDPVFTRRPWRRRGLASALLGMALSRLRERGMTSAQLEVDSENPYQAPSLYARHRFASDRSSEEWHRPLER